MKANEAPEKMYISYEGYGVFGEDSSTERTKNSQIEYIRTDAFIEKAISFIRDNIESDKYRTPDEESYRMGCNFDYFETNMFIEDFKQAMKGE